MNADSSIAGGWFQANIVKLKKLIVKRTLIQIDALYGNAVLFYVSD